MGRYVSRKYGKAKLIQEEHDGNRAAYTYEDKQYGFTYQASAHRSLAWFDGPFPWYHTVRDSDFEKQYYACLTGLLEEDIRGVEETYHVLVEPMDIRQGGYTVMSFGLAEVSPGDTGQDGGVDGASGPDLEAACVAVADLYAGKDTRGFWEEGRVYAYEGDTLCGYAGIREEGGTSIAGPGDAESTEQGCPIGALIPKQKKSGMEGGFSLWEEEEDLEADRMVVSVRVGAGGFPATGHPAHPATGVEDRPAAGGVIPAAGGGAGMGDTAGFTAAALICRIQEGERRSSCHPGGAAPHLDGAGAQRPGNRAALHHSARREGAGSRRISC